MDAVSSYTFRDHFLTGDSPGLAATSGNVGLGWYAPAKADFVVQHWTGEDNHPGVVLLSSNTTTIAVNGAMALTGSGVTTQFVASNLQRFRIQVRTTTNIDNLSIIVGFGSEGHAAGNADDLGTHGVFFVFRSTLSSKWQGTTRLSSSSTSVVGSGPVVFPDTWYVLEATYDGTRWEFFVDGSIIGTVNTTLPTTQTLTAACKFRKASTGTPVIRSYQVDEFVVAYDLVALEGKSISDWQDSSGGPSQSSRGTYHVDDFGAVAQPFNGSDTSEEERTNNVIAIQAALDAALEHGGTVLIGPGWYYTNGKVGYDLTVDKNAQVIIQGLSGFTLIHSNNYTEPVLQLRTTGGNIRDLVVNDIVLLGGREGLHLYWCAYSRFNRIWFWGSKNFALQDEFGNGNVFDECRFDESAQGIADGTQADAAIFVSCEERLSNCNFGEFCGGIVTSNGELTLVNCIFHDCRYRGRGWFSYALDAYQDISYLLPKTASLILSGGYAIMTGCFGDCWTRTVLVFRGTELIMSACRFLASPGVDFAGFVEIWPLGAGDVNNACALNMSATTFNFGAQPGFIIQDLENSLHDALVQVQVILTSGTVVTPLSSSAPTLLNPAGQSNSVNLRVFTR